MKKPIALLIILILSVTASLHISDSSRADEPPPLPIIKNFRWEKSIRDFEEQDKKTPPPADAALFIGSSSIRMWTTLAEDFSEIPVINRGFGGSEIADSTRYFDRIVTPYKPRLIVLYAGGNDLERGKTPAQVAQDFQAFAAKAKTTLPDVPVVYISTNPSLKRWSSDAKTREANRLIAEAVRGQKQLHFIDSYPGLLDAEGKPRPELLQKDGLHLNREGYKVWVSIVKEPIMKLYQEAKAAS